MEELGFDMASCAISVSVGDVHTFAVDLQDAMDLQNSLAERLLDLFIEDTRAEAARIGDSSDGQYEEIINFAMRQVADRMQMARNSLSLTKTKDHE